MTVTTEQQPQTIFKQKPDVLLNRTIVENHETLQAVLVQDAQGQVSEQLLMHLGQTSSNSPNIVAAKSQSDVKKPGL